MQANCSCFFFAGSRTQKNSQVCRLEELGANKAASRPFWIASGGTGLSVYFRMLLLFAMTSKKSMTLPPTLPFILHEVGRNCPPDQTKPFVNLERGAVSNEPIQPCDTCYAHLNVSEEFFRHGTHLPLPFRRP